MLRFKTLSIQRGRFPLCENYLDFGKDDGKQSVFSCAIALCEISRSSREGSTRLGRNSGGVTTLYGIVRVWEDV
jgi:hypothetical protein